MKTAFYNPSKLEIDIVKAIVALSPDLQKQLEGIEIVDMKADYTSDNPYLVIRTKDADGDFHEVVMQAIQRPDGLIK